LPWTALVDGEPTGVHREVEDALGTFSRAGYFTQHMWGLQGRMLAALYAGEGALARELYARDLPKLHASGLFRVQFVRVLTGWLSALGPLATGLRESEPVERSIRALEKEQLAWGNGLARLLRAGLLAKSGRRAEASSALAAGAALLDASGVPLFAAAARRWRGVLIGGLDGAALTQQADRWLGERTVASPIAFSRMLCPGPWDT
jgi:eukaryotic-like serine/threonine-protein kinase